jgi:magnesium-transporting ATPase (P-type)
MTSEVNSTGHEALEGKVTVSHIYKLTKEQLRALFNKPDLESRCNDLKSKEFGNMRGVLRKLATDSNTGIIGDKKDLARRTKVFTANSKPLPATPKFLDSIKQEGSNKMWWVVGGSALLSGLCGAFVLTPWYMGIWEGISIILAAMFIMLVSSVADMIKDRRFVELLSMNKEDSVPVIRGKFGATQSISIWSLVVGDIVLLSAGTRIPADCFVIEQTNLEVTDKDGQKNQKFAAPDNEDSEVP